MLEAIYRETPTLTSGTGRDSRVGQVADFDAAESQFDCLDSVADSVRVLSSHVEGRASECQPSQTSDLQN